MSTLPEETQTTTEIVEKFKQILKSNGINDEVAEVLVEDAGLKSEGFASQTNCVTVKFRDISKKPLNLFVKTQTTNASHTQFLEDSKVFEKEAEFYTKYVPTALELCKSKGHENLLEIYPKCYYGDEKMIVFENLVLDKGYTLLDKAERQDFNSACLALKTLAKHHAISYAVISNVGGADAFLKRFPYIQYEAMKAESSRKMMEPFSENAITIITEIIERSDLKEKDEILKIVKPKAGKVWDVVMAGLEVNPETDKILVLNHGDFWNNNMMFRKDKEGKVVGHIAIDLQVVRYACPTIDISYFLFSSVKSKVRRRHFKELLTVYLDTLNETSEKLDYPTGISYDDLFAAYKCHVDYGLWFFGIVSATKAPFEVLKDLDKTQVDMNDFGKVFANLIYKWMEAHPEECKNDANEIAKLLLEEYKPLID